MRQTKLPRNGFERFLQTSAVDLEIFLPASFAQEYCDFYLNPRYLRGSDFLMRWSQGRWAEDVVVRAINATGEFLAVPYGPSSVAPTEPREMELYFERLDRAGGVGKQPDLLILTKAGYGAIQEKLGAIGLENIPFTPEPSLAFLRDRALMAVEVENSLWVAKEMPHYGQGRPMKWKGRPDLIGFAKNQKVPTVIIKDEDLEPLQEWETRYQVPVYVFHVFYDLAYFIALQQAMQLIEEGVITPTRQTFYAPGGPTTHKYIYKIFYTLAHPLGEMVKEPEMVARFIQDPNGHILPYVHFSGGELALSSEIIAELRSRVK